MKLTPEKSQTLFGERLGWHWSSIYEREIARLCKFISSAKGGRTSRLGSRMVRIQRPKTLLAIILLRQNCWIEFGTGCFRFGSTPNLLRSSGSRPWTASAGGALRGSAPNLLRNSGSRPCFAFLCERGSGRRAAFASLGSFQLCAPPR